MGLRSFISRLALTLGKLGEIYKYGGITNATIVTPCYDKILEGQCVLVTGGSSGIGLAIAQKCLSAGASVIITGRNRTKLQSVIDNLGDDRLSYLVWDISDNSLLRTHLEKCRHLFGKDIDVLVNNAGVPPLKFFGEVDEQEWCRVYNTNLKGSYFLTQEVVKQWKTTSFEGYKHILNISSQGGYVGATYPYRMAKWDMRGLTEGLGKLLIKDRIVVNGIAPGVVKTSMQEFSLLQGENLYTEQNLINRVILPEEIAELALFLISGVANAIVGQTVVCDGGFTLK